MTYLGICDAAGYTLVVVSDNLDLAQRLLYTKWRKTVTPGFQPTVKSFADLNEWNGAQVKAIEPDKAHIWEQLA